MPSLSIDNYICLYRSLDAAFWRVQPSFDEKSQWWNPQIKGKRCERNKRPWQTLRPPNQPKCETSIRSQSRVRFIPQLVLAKWLHSTWLWNWNQLIAVPRARKLTLVVFLTNDLLISASMEVWTPCLDSPNASKRLLLPIFDRQEFATVRANRWTSLNNQSVLWNSITKQ